MKSDYFTDEEKKFLYNSIVRLHKENGSFSEFKRSPNTLENCFLQCKTSNVAEYLIGFVWKICRDSFTDLNPLEVGIRASILFIGIYDILYESKFPIFKRLCAEIAINEFGYIETTLIDIGDEERRKISNDLKKSINDCYEKYKHLTGDHKFHYIPID